MGRRPSKVSKSDTTAFLLSMALAVPGLLESVAYADLFAKLSGYWLLRVVYRDVLPSFRSPFGQTFDTASHSHHTRTSKPSG